MSIRAFYLVITEHMTTQLTSREGTQQLLAKELRAKELRAKEHRAKELRAKEHRI